MEEERPVSLRRVEWEELFPWWRLARAGVMALRPRVWVVVIAGLLVTEGGRQVLEYTFLNTPQLPALPHGLALFPLNRLADPVFSPTPPRVDRPTSPRQRPAERSWLAEFFGTPRLIPMVGVWADLTNGYRYFLEIPAISEQPGRPRQVPESERTWTAWLKRLLYFVWVFGVWSICGGVVVRGTTLELAHLESPGLGGLARFVGQRWPVCMASILGGWVAIFAAGWLCALVCLGAWWFANYVGPLVIVWPVTALFGFLLMCVAVLILFGWPLILASIVIDRQDGYGAVGAAGAYLMRRPLHLLFYVLVATVIGGVIAALVALLVEWVIVLTLWAAHLALPATIFQELLRRGDLAGWNDVFRQLTAVYIYGHFWASVAVVYLLLRHQVDQTDFDEMFVEEPCFDAPPKTFPASTAAATGTSDNG